MNIFKQALMTMVKSNRFDLSHDVKTSFKMGQLVPTCVMDVIPGDIVTIGVENMLRFAPLVAPVMHKVNVTTHYFYVPNRILYDGWEDFITGEDDAEPPYVSNSNGYNPGTLADYLGIPDFGSGLAQRINALPVAAYFKIYDEYYRDQNLQTKQFAKLVPGQNNAHYLSRLLGEPLHRAWEHDYFTSALPFAQKGNAVTLPLLNDQEVDVTIKDPLTGESQLVVDADGNSITGNLAGEAGIFAENSGLAQNAFLDPNGTYKVNINEEASTIETLRRAFRTQEFLEKDARGGTRYIENILSHFGIRSSDKRLNRPEYIGGSKQNMVISEVLSTAQTSVGGSETPVGQMSGHGISVGGGNTFKYKAEEHGFIIGIISVTPKTCYQQGLQRMFNRPDRLDYAWPTFANIGEQEIKVSELYTGNGSTTEGLNETFGYIPRYSEYKSKPSMVTGQMKTTLAYWHLGRIFDEPPALNSEFIECIPDERIFAVSGEDTIIAHIFNNISAVRKLPRFGIPTF